MEIWQFGMLVLLTMSLFVFYSDSLLFLPVARLICDGGTAIGNAA